MGPGRGDLAHLRGRRDKHNCLAGRYGGQAHRRVRTGLCHHARAAGVLVVSAAPQGTGAGRVARDVAEDRHRSLRAGAAGERGPEAGPRRRQADAAPAGDARSHRAAADAGRDRGVREGRGAGRVCKGGGSPARVAALRRSVGPHVARRRAIRRGRLPVARSQGPRPEPVSERLPVSRLGDQGLQRRHAVRPVRAGAARRRPAGRRSRPRPHAAGAGVPWPRAVVLRQRRGRGHARRRAPRSRGCRVPRLPRADGRLRALPRPQVRRDSDQGLLLARRRVPEHLVPRVSAGAEERRRGIHAAGQEDREEGEAARGVHEHGIDAAGGDPRAAGVEIHDCRVEGDRRAEGRDRRRSSMPRSSITSSSTAGSSSSRSRRASIPT